MRVEAANIACLDKERTRQIGFHHLVGHQCLHIRVGRELGAGFVAVDTLVGNQFVGGRYFEAGFQVGVGKQPGQFAFVKFLARRRKVRVDFAGGIVALDRFDTAVLDQTGVGIVQKMLDLPVDHIVGVGLHPQ